MLQAHSSEDEIAMGNLLGEKQDFLEKALHNYILCLKAGVSLTMHWWCESNHALVVGYLIEGLNVFVILSGYTYIVGLLLCMPNTE